jgi:hypothetical protein
MLALRLEALIDVFNGPRRECHHPMHSELIGSVGP